MPPDDDTQAAVRAYVRALRDEDIAKANLYRTVDTSDGEALSENWDAYVKARQNVSELSEPSDEPVASEPAANPADVPASPPGDSRDTQHTASPSEPADVQMVDTRTDGGQDIGGQTPDQARIAELERQLEQARAGNAS